jgi:hypothetical protein
LGQYALYWGGLGGGGGTTNISNNVTINGDVFINGNISMGNGATIHGNSQATGNNTGGSVTGTRDANVTAPTNPPYIDTTYYLAQLAIAAGYSASNPTWNGGTITGTTYIHGNLTLKGNITVSGNALVVVTGTIDLNNNCTISVPAGTSITVIAGGAVTFNNNVQVATGTSRGKVVFYSNTYFTCTNNVFIGNINDGVVFICPNDLAGFANNVTFYGFLYCGGTLTIGNNSYFYGNILANNVLSITNNASITLVPGLSDISSVQGVAGGVITNTTTWEEVF